MAVKYLKFKSPEEEIKDMVRVIDSLRENGFKGKEIPKALMKLEYSPNLILPALRKSRITPIGSRRKLPKVKITYRR